MLNKNRTLQVVKDGEDAAAAFFCSSYLLQLFTNWDDIRPASLLGAESQNDARS